MSSAIDIYADDQYTIACGIVDVYDLSARIDLSCMFGIVNGKIVGEWYRATKADVLWHEDKHRTDATPTLLRTRIPPCPPPRLLQANYQMSQS